MWQEGGLNFVGVSATQGSKRTVKHYLKIFIDKQHSETVDFVFCKPVELTNERKNGAPRASSHNYHASS